MVNPFVAKAVRAPLRRKTSMLQHFCDDMLLEVMGKVLILVKYWRLVMEMRSTLGWQYLLKLRSVFKSIGRPLVTHSLLNDQNALNYVRNIK